MKRSRLSLFTLNFGSAKRHDPLRFVPRVVCLEDRTVPNTYFFDPNAVDNGDGTSTFDNGLSTAWTGPNTGTANGTVFTSLDDAAAAAASNPGRDTIRIATGNITMTLDSPDSGVFNDAGGVDLVGDGTGNSILTPNYSSSSPNASLGVLEFGNVTPTPFSVTGLTIDATGQNMEIGLSANNVGTIGVVNNVNFENIIYPSNGNDSGVAVNVFAGADVTVENSTFTQIGEYGIFASGSGTSVSLMGNTYTGKGAVSQLDYFAIITNDATGVISGNFVSANLGSIGSFTSGAVVVQDAGGGPGSASIFGNTFSNDTTGVFVGNGTIPGTGSDTSTATIEYNNLEQTGAGNSGIITGLAPGLTIAANYNYWGATTGPTSATYNGGAGASADSGVIVNQIRENPITQTAAPTLADFLSTLQPIGPTLAVASSSGGVESTLALTAQGQFNASTGTTFDQRVAVGDVTGNGYNDVVVASGPGTPGMIWVFDGMTGAVVYQFSAMDGFTGGLYVAVGDFNRDGKDEIVVTPGAGGGPRVEVYDLSSGAPVVIQSFFALDQNLRTGLTVAVADVNGDRTPDILVMPGPGGGPEAAFFNGAQVFSGSVPSRLFNDQFLANQNLRTGYFIGAGDVNGTGIADYAVSMMSGNSQVLIWNGQAVMASGTNVVNAEYSFFADSNDVNGDVVTNGIRIALVDLDGDGQADLITGDSAPGSLVQVFFANTGSLSTGKADQSVTLISSTTGVNVA